MIVYRVERNGMGPYLSYDYKQPPLREMYIHHQRSAEHPAIWMDCDNSEGLPAPGHPLRCGFVSFHQFRAWFAGYLRVLRRCGFELSWYEVPDHKVRKGTHQAAFLVDEATLMGSCSVLVRKDPAVAQD